MNKLIAALGDNIKPAGKNWIARCSVHNDKDFAMSIKQVDNGSVIAHCFACGANGLDLYQSLGLDLDELFGGKKLDNNHVPNDIKQTIKTDTMCVKMYESGMEKGVQFSLDDRRRYRLAQARIKGVAEKYPNI